MDVIQTKHWYWRWWGILLIILFVIVVAGIAFVGALIFDSVREIKGGRGQALQNKIYAGFTPSTVNTAFGSMTAPERSDLERADSPYLGNSAAPVVIVEFLDFKCPNCETAAPIMRQVLEKYGSKVKLIVRHFPVETTHPGATRFSEIAYCAQQQGRFWPVLNYFFDHQSTLPQTLSSTDGADLVASAQLDSEALSRCLTSPTAATAINRDYVDGAKFGVRGTPTFFVNGEKIEGVIPWAVWDSFLKQQ